MFDSYISRYIKNDPALIVTVVPAVSDAKVTPNVPEGLAPVMKYASPVARLELVVAGTPVEAAFCVFMAPQDRNAKAVALFGACM
jgi:hypothetical protein